jgi:hypothetical protein
MTAAPTAAKSTGFRAALGDHVYISEEESMLSARIPPCLYQYLHVSKNMCDWRGRGSFCQNAALATVAAAAAALPQRCRNTAAAFALSSASLENSTLEISAPFSALFEGVQRQAQDGNRIRKAANCRQL